MPSLGAGGGLEMQVRRFVLCLSFSLMLTPSVGFSQDYAFGKSAYKVGDFATALSVFTNLAVGGCSPVWRDPGLAELDQIFKKTQSSQPDCALAQHYLAKMYFLGDGVPQDYVAAHMWFNISAANGVAGSQYMRDLVASQMTQADISEAQRRASVCVTSSYQDCGLARGWWPW